MTRESIDEFFKDGVDETVAIGVDHPSTASSSIVDSIHQGGDAVGIRPRHQHHRHVLEDVTVVVQDSFRHADHVLGARRMKGVETTDHQEGGAFMSTVGIRGQDQRMQRPTLPAGSVPFETNAILPAILIVVFGAIWLYDRAHGGYQPEKLSAEQENATPSVER